MSDLEKNIKRISDKLQQLLKNYHLLKKENEWQNNLIKELKESNQKDVEQIKVLQKQIIILKASAGKINEADKKALEKEINQYIRKIDQCINSLGG